MVQPGASTAIENAENLAESHAARALAYDGLFFQGKVLRMKPTHLLPSLGLLLALGLTEADTAHYRFIDFSEGYGYR